MSIKQREKDSRRDNIRCYDAEMTQVDRLNDRVAFSKMIEGLLLSKISWFYAKKPLITYSELLERAKKYANAKDQH